jgi:PAS domain S-box-containing protein
MAQARRSEPSGSYATSRPTRMPEEAQGRLAAIVASSADAIISKTLDGIVTSWNEAAERMFGYPASEMIGQSIRRLIPADRQAEEDMILACLARGERIEHYETIRVAKDGRTINVSVTVSPMQDDSGRIIGASKIARDITERKEAENALRQSREHLELLSNTVPAVIFYLDHEQRYMSVNNEFTRWFGVAREEVIGRTAREFVGEEVWAIIGLRLVRAYAGETVDHEAEAPYRLGGARWVHVVYTPHIVWNGAVQGVVGLITDITARKPAEEELRKSEERFRSSLLHSPLPILLLDDQEQILAVSHSWIEQTGYSREELRFLEDWTARACGERSGDVLRHIRQFKSAEPQVQSAEFAIRTKDGRERLWSFVYSALGIQSDKRRLFVCMAQDVTERKAREEHIQLLMREVNHRAKNMLSVVDAIARQTASKNPDDFVERFSERVQALSANQGLLVRNEWQGVDVEDLVRAQLGGPKLHLGAASAQAIGLALHELATNAGKYGALSTSKGRVDVWWAVAADTFTMSWTENDGPPVIAPRRRGFGTTIINTMTKRSLGGEVALRYAPSGLIWQLTCPAANALDRAAHEKMSKQDAS